MIGEKIIYLYLPSEKNAETFAPVAVVLGDIPQCCALQTPRDKDKSISSNLCSSISSPTSLKLKYMF